MGRIQSGTPERLYFNLAFTLCVCVCVSDERELTSSRNDSRHTFPIFVCLCERALAQHSPLLLRVILAELPLALPLLGGLAVAFSAEFTSAPCCFSSSVSVLESSNSLEMSR